MKKKKKKKKQTKKNKQTKNILFSRKMRGLSGMS